MFEAECASMFDPSSLRTSSDTAMTPIARWVFESSIFFQSTILGEWSISMKTVE